MNKHWVVNVRILLGGKNSINTLGYRMNFKDFSIKENLKKHMRHE